MRKLIHITLRLSVLVGIICFLTLIGAGKSHARMLKTCSNIKVSFREGYRFISEEEIKLLLEKNYGACIGERIDSIRLDKIEASLSTQSPILKSEAFITDDGVLNIEISQRKPVLRLQMGESGFYVDNSGYIFPLRQGYPYLMPVVDGAIDLDIREGHFGPAPEEKGRKWVADMLAMLNYMEGHPVWAENIAQMHVDENQDLLLFPREGREIFVFGYPDDFQQKFSRIENYYNYIKPSREEGWYRTVNVKFDKQIICKK